MENSSMFLGAVIGFGIAAVCLLVICFFLVKCCYHQQQRKNAKEKMQMVSYDTLRRESEIQEKNHKTDVSLKLIDNELYDTSDRSPTRKKAETPEVNVDLSANVYESVGDELYETSNHSPTQKTPETPEVYESVRNELYEISSNSPSPTRKTAENPEVNDPSANVYEDVR